MPKRENRVGEEITHMNRQLTESIENGKLFKKLFKHASFDTIVDFERVIPEPIELSEVLRNINAADLNTIIELLTKTIAELPNGSTSNKGILGWFNRRKRNKKLKHFNWQMGAYPNNPIVIAEGDSWFEHPLIADGIDWLQEDHELNTISLAAGADWLVNMLKQREYLKELKGKLNDNKQVAAIVLSAGGNDIVDENLKTVISKDVQRNEVPSDVEQYARNEFPQHWKAIVEGWKYLTPKFYVKLSLFLTLYTLLFQEIRRVTRTIRPEASEQIRLLLHGYDFAYPSKAKSIGNSSFGGYLYKLFFNGNNLYKPMQEIGIPERLMHPIASALIFEFNNMIALINRHQLDVNFCHVDFRGLFKDENWNDELHITGKHAEWIGAAFSYAICTKENPKTVALRDNTIQKEVEKQWKNSLPKI